MNDGFRDDEISQWEPDEIESLILKWRETATDSHVSLEMSIVYRTCADDLESALVGQDPFSDEEE